MAYADDIPMQNVDAAINNIIFFNIMAFTVYFIIS